MPPVHPVTPPRALTTLTALLILVALGSFWVFGRFTVDDAFITWRYGVNLIRHGIWAYNPDGFDLTQAYTNPVFALASIPVAAAGWDMVLSFKLLSLAVLAGLGWALIRLAEVRGRMAFVLALLMALPATVAHAVSGLETVLYGGALALWFITQRLGHWRAALGLVLLLVLTRPEAWLLYGLHPLMLLLARVPRRMLMAHLAALGAMAALYFGFHLAWFGHALPNTHVIKSGDGFSLTQAARLLPWALPGLMVLAFGHRSTGLALVLYFGAVGYSYSGSDLLMNYMQRFAFQIMLPMALVLGWALARKRIRFPNWGLAGLTGYVLAFGMTSGGLGEHLGIANYYPRLLESHVAFGRVLNALAAEGRVRAFAAGDAGAPAFHAGIRALDTIGLASSRRAHEGLTPELVRAYAPDVLTFFANAQGLRDLPDRHDALFTHAAEEGMSELCTLTWASQYRLILYTRGPVPELTALCASSLAANGADELTFALRQLASPPWLYWRE